ncbi:hypothetical protein EH11_01525 [Bacillus subtilis]|nr:hypothetical protein HS3_00327 [Bacillus subtilis]RPK02195.1 hypothetical protein EH11_01525 [Bacillus subtilis]RPK11382.1 hypothetical protein EH5_01547 [Bacillus subtilis]RUS08401.1 hypothetical protein EFW59_01529 [Bacillus subtilis]
MDILSSNWEYSILHIKKTAESFFLILPEPDAFISTFFECQK